MIRKEDYKAMEVRVNGEWKELNVLKTLSDGSCLYIVGEHNSEGTYFSGGCIPAEQYREIEPKTEMLTRVKSRTDVVKALIEHGYELNSHGGWYLLNSSKESFLREMFETCGKKPTYWTYEDEWLEEVEADIED